MERTSIIVMSGVDLSIPTSAAIAALLLAWVAIVYLVVAFGVRSGERVWAGAHIGRLPPEQRWWSLFYGLTLMTSGLVLIDLANTGLDWIPTQWTTSVGFATTCLLGFATILSLVKGTTWERMFFAPITLLGTLVAYWLTFM